MPNAARTSAVLIALAAGEDERLTVREIVEALRQQAFALLVVVLALPNCLPMPPPIPLISGILLAFVALQIVLRRATPWLPRRLLDKSVARAEVASAVGRALPALRRLERWSKPRLRVFETALGMRLVGVVLLVVALGLLVAAPFVGQIPLGLAACLIGLGLVERDGVVVIAGFLVGAAGISLSLGFVVALVSGLEAIL
ncbi:exopolysaccharide biosynthesis protein [Chelatococcus sp. SYSU_G07232]|uniref:Exopolysaccharide biosynthesis protein n=1 Tax=Chelatococcus albus TaxID=3047466 RepID=A0ABT7AJC4_9HYPH|nr:exopolysaccharide biosynthesis protein [Chelatococcus sp. SYSU_G07232]MDJ1159481.1 exopolysaccharide biosynthesis protein [Chelatococcus sp. SYSU_G07232]